MGSNPEVECNNWDMHRGEGRCSLATGVPLEPEDQDHLGVSRCIERDVSFPARETSLTASLLCNFSALRFSRLHRDEIGEQWAFAVQVLQQGVIHSCFPEISPCGCFARSLFPQVPCSRDRRHPCRRTTLSRTVRNRPSVPWTPVETSRKARLAPSSFRAKHCLEPARGWATQRPWPACPRARPRAHRAPPRDKFSNTRSTLSYQSGCRTWACRPPESCLPRAQPSSRGH